MESQESRNNRSEAIFKEIMIENLPKLKQTVKPQIYESLYIYAEKIITGRKRKERKRIKRKLLKQKTKILKSAKGISLAWWNVPVVPTGG